MATDNGYRYQGVWRLAEAQQIASDFTNAIQRDVYWPGLEYRDPSWPAGVREYVDQNGDLQTEGVDPYTDNVSLLLNGNGTDGAQNNTFIDSSPNNFTITRNGNVTQGSFSPFPLNGAGYDPAVHGGSGYFDGAGDYLAVPSDAAFGYGTGDFTIEFFIYFKSLTAATFPIIFDQRTGNPQAAPAIYYNGSLLYYVSGADRINGGALSVGTWYHIAVCRSGTSTKMFVDGLQVGSTYTDSNNYITAPVTIGTYAPSPAAYYTNAYFSDVRIVKGTALYTSNFTPPTAPLTAISGTELLLNFTNAGIVDSTGKNNLETVGNAQIDTTVKKYGTGSIKFDGSGDYLTIPSNDQFEIGVSDITIESWLYLTGYPTNNNGVYSSMICCKDVEGSRGFNFYLAGTPSSFSGISYSSPGAWSLSANYSFVLNTWYHVAVSVKNSYGILFVNGTKIGEGNVGTVPQSSSLFKIGSNDYNTTYRYYLNGYIDDFRFTKGVARYTENFTPPTREITAIKGVVRT